MSWRRLNGDLIEEPIIQSVENTIIREQEAGFKLKLCIGTDSQSRNDHVDFATVIVFLREGRGGFMFIHHSSYKGAMKIKERMITEVAKSIEIAYQLCEILEKHDIALEVHADINTDPSFKSNTALKEAMGYILSMGFIFKAKPDAFASSYCADKVV